MPAPTSPYAEWVTVTRKGWKFVRVSMEYIDVFPPGASTAADCINVYDYASGGPSVHPENRPEHVRLAEEWLADHEASLGEYAAISRQYDRPRG